MTKAEYENGSRILREFEVNASLRNLTPKLEQNPGDQATRAELQKYVSEAEQIAWATQDGKDLLARAQAALRK